MTSPLQDHLTLTDSDTARREMIRYVRRCFILAVFVVWLSFGTMYAVFRDYRLDVQEQIFSLSAQKMFVIACIISTAALLIVALKIVKKFLHNSHAMEMAYETRAQAMIDAHSRKGRNNFFTHMSHELRTPVNAMLGFADMLKKMPLDNMQRDYVMRIVDSGDVLLNMMNDMIDMSKIEAKQLHLECIAFNIKYLMDHVLALSQNKMQQSPVRLEGHMGEDVPTHVKGDPTRLRQILMNLVAHAVRTTNEGSIHVRIAVKAQEQSTQDDTIVIQCDVEGTGAGMSAEQQKHIFDPFLQTDTTETHNVGVTGLGLGMTKLLVELMGGCISVESAEGQGSHFSCTIPFKMARPIPCDIQPLEIEELRGRQVVIIDGAANARTLVKKYCQEFLMEVAKCFDDTAAALEWLSVYPDPVHLIILDIIVQSAEGQTFIRSLKSYPHLVTTKVMAITADAWPGTADICKQIGFDAFLPKPIVKSDFLKTIGTVLGVRHTLGTSKLNIPLVTRHLANELACEGVRVLLAEDNLTNQTLMGAHLRRFGCDYDIVGNGKEVVEKIQERDYDLCLMDLHMPLMGGLRAAEIIRKDLKMEIPIIALTVSVMRGDQETCLRAGMNDYLEKPIIADALRQKILTWSGKGLEH